MSQGKGDKRRPCCIPSWLEDFRWARLGTLSGEEYNAIAESLRINILAHPDDRKYLTGAELELLDGNV